MLFTVLDKFIVVHIGAGDGDSIWSVITMDVMIKNVTIK